MKKLFATIAATVAILSGSAYAESVKLPEVSANDLSQAGYTVFETNGKPFITVEKKYLQRVTVGVENCSFEYFNDSDYRVSPDVKIVAYNKYGMVVASCSDSWFSSIKPYDARSEENWSTYHNPKLVMGKANIAVSGNLNRIDYIAVSVK